MKLATLEGRKVAVWGCGREGHAALSALRRHLPNQTLTLFCSESEARDLSERHGLNVRTQAPNAEALAGFEFVIKSPGISIYKPEVLAAQACGTVFTSGTALWFGENPDARVIGITGTKGKSTTAAMTAHIARAAGVRTALAGNIGLPLLELDGQQADLWVVELSSFQTGEAGPLDVGVVTCLYEEHLDWHGSRERYVADKLKLADVSCTLVVNAGQPNLLQRTAQHRRRITFAGDAGWTVQDGHLCRHGVTLDAPLSHLPGLHNALDACAALTAFECVHPFDQVFTPAMAVQSLASYQPLPHRLQPLGKQAGLDWIDDSISTTPEATRVALQSLAGRAVTVILGGHDRGLDWESFAQFATAQPDLRCIVQGGNGQRIGASLRAAGMQTNQLHTANTLDEAVVLATTITAAGDVVLLSPGAPSFDQFHNYAERGREFARLAGFDPSICGSIQGLGIA